VSTLGENRHDGSVESWQRGKDKVEKFVAWSATAPSARVNEVHEARRQAGRIRLL